MREDFKDGNKMNLCCELPMEVKGSVMTVEEDLFRTSVVDKMAREAQNVNDLMIAIEVLKRELRKDRDEGSYYHSWQSNLAVIMMDSLGVEHGDANRTAKAFLELLIRD